MSERTNTGAGDGEPPAAVTNAEAGTELLPRDDVEPPVPGPPPGRMGVLSQLRWGWRQLTSMRTALVLLFLLALAAVPGSVLPQRPRNPSDVAGFLENNPQVAPILDRLWLFNVFGSPWFAAIYLLLFISLTGCVVPRSWRHLQAVRARPPRAPRNLSRLPVSTRWETDASPEDASESARAVLRRGWFRVDTDGTTVAAEKGYLRETGNLIFHLGLLALLIAVAAGELFGYHGRVLVVEDEGFANTRTSYASYTPGQFTGPMSMQPFTLDLLDFRATYVRGGSQHGQPRDFEAAVRYRATPEAAADREVIGVNDPLVVSGTKVYLLGHGYAPTFVVRDGQGNVAYQGAVPFLPRNTGNFTSDGVIKVPDAEPEQLAFTGLFTPTTMPSQGPMSAFPAPVNPTVTLLAHKGDLLVSSGVTESVFDLDTSGLTRVKAQQLSPGERMDLPDDLGSITFTGYKEWAGLRVTDDPAKRWALGSALVVLFALLLTLGVRRRRVWVRASRGAQGRTVVEVGALTRGDAARGFRDEVAALVERMRPQSSEPVDEPNDQRGPADPTDRE